MAKKKGAKEQGFLDLLIHDFEINRDSMKVLADNCGALKTWLPGITDLKTRETYRLFLIDAEKVLRALWRQRKEMIKISKEKKLEFEASEPTPAPTELPAGYLEPDPPTVDSIRKKNGFPPLPSSSDPAESQ